MYTDMAKLEDKGILNEEIFGQLLEMDRDDGSEAEHSFSKPLAIEYITQAGDTIETIHDTLCVCRLTTTMIFTSIHFSLLFPELLPLLSNKNWTPYTKKAISSRVPLLPSASVASLLFVNNYRISVNARIRTETSFSPRKKLSTCLLNASQSSSTASTKAPKPLLPFATLQIRKSCVSNNLQFRVKTYWTSAPSTRRANLPTTLKSTATTTTSTPPPYPTFLLPLLRRHGRHNRHNRQVHFLPSQTRQFLTKTRTNPRFPRILRKKIHSNSNKQLQPPKHDIIK